MNKKTLPLPSLSGLVTRFLIGPEKWTTNYLPRETIVKMKRQKGRPSIGYGMFGSGSFNFAQLILSSAISSMQLTTSRKKNGYPNLV